MKNKYVLKKLAAFIITLALLLGLVPLNDFSVYAANDFNDVPISSDGNVKASYNETAKKLIITGTGTIDYDLWKQMAQGINPDYFGTETAWDGNLDEDFKMIFKGDADDSILLCEKGNEGGLFQRFSNEILFLEPVNLAPDAKVLSDMFAGAYTFNQPINNWDVSHVTHMNGMFWNAQQFDHPLNNWDVSNVTNMDHMFYGASAFNQPLNNWDVSHVKNMSDMFGHAKSFNQPLNSWNTTNVNDMSEMFTMALQYNEEIVFDISSLTTIVGAFSPSKVRSIQLLNNSAAQDIEVSSGSQYPDDNTLEYLEFNGLKAHTIKANAFTGNYVVEDVAAQTTTNYTVADPFTFEDNKHYKLYLQGKKDIKACDIEPLPIPDQVYTGNPITPALTLSDSVTGVTLQEDTDYELTYSDNTNVGTACITITGKGTNYTGSRKVYFEIADEVNFFNGVAISLDGGLEASYSDATKELIITGAGTIDYNLWKQMAQKINADYFGTKDAWDTNNAEDFKMIFNGDADNAILLCGTGDKGGLFQNFSNEILFQKQVNLAPDATNLTSMFAGAKAFNQPINNWDVSHVTNMYGMFNGAMLFDGNISDWDVSNVTNMVYMFYGAKNFNGDINKWNVSSVTDMYCMFGGASLFNKPLDGWNTANVTNMQSMFENALQFNEAVLFDISSLKTIAGAFKDSKVRSIQLSNYAGNTDVEADVDWDNDGVPDGFKLYPDGTLEYLEFSGLKAHTIQANTFTGDYIVEDVAAQTATPFTANTAFTFEANKHYKLYLQGKKDIKACDIDPSPTPDQVYTGNPITPVLTLTDSVTGVTLQEGTDYELTYSDNTNAGTACITITGKGTNYTGSRKVYFKIAVEVNYFNDFAISLDDGVKASYSDVGKALTITGAGTIDYNLWKQMAQKINPDYFGTEHAWDSNIDEDFKIIFNGDADNSILLCSTGDKGNLFQRFSNEILFQKQVNLAPDVTVLASMFGGAKAFNQPINNWDVSNVTNMYGMFWNADHFDQPLDSWDVSNVTNMSHMFYSADIFNQPLDNWDVSKVTRMGSMFYRVKKFDQPLNSWNTAKVKNMRTMLEGASQFDEAIEFDISSLKTIAGAFKDSKVRSIQLSNSAGNTDVEADIDWNNDGVPDGFKLYPDGTLEYLEFSGLKAHTIQANAFSGDYIVEDVAAQTATPFTANSPFTFEANKHYKLYLQGKKDIKACDIEPLPIPDQVYTGNPITPALTLSDSLTGSTLQEGTDYELTYSDNTNVGTACIAITGKGTNYTGSRKVYFEIVNEANLNNFAISLDGGVKASYSDAEKELTIIGTGTIDYNLWKQMAQKINPNYFGTEDAWDVNNSEDFKMIFNGDSDNSILFCGTSEGRGLFEGFSNEISFNTPVNLATSATDISRMFLNAKAFNEEIEGWDTSNVTDMSFMFYGTEAFNQALNSWNTANVTKMGHMFENALQFNASVVFDISSLTSIRSAFENSQARSIQLLNNGTAQDIEVASNDAQYPDGTLEYLEFSGLKAHTIQANAFVDDYIIENITTNTTTTCAVTAPYSFNANDHYKLHLVELPALTLADITKFYQVGQTTTAAINLAALLPADASYQSTTMGAIGGSNPSILATGSAAPQVNGGVLTYQLSGSGTAGDTAILPLTITSANYQDVSFNLIVKLIGDNDDEDDDDDDEDDDSSTETESATLDETKVPLGGAFNDVLASDWFKDAVDYVVANGLMQGTGPATFTPKGAATRAMGVTLLYRMAGEPAVDLAHSFPDVETGSWYCKPVIWGAITGIVKGFPDGNFRPYDALTREQLVTLLYRYAQYKNYKVSERADLSGYSDAKSITPYALEALQWAVEKGIIEGTSATTLSPQGVSNRAQLATIMMRFHKLFAK